MIKELRNEMGLTQRSFARLIFVSQPIISKAENGKIQLGEKQTKWVKQLHQENDDKKALNERPVSEVARMNKSMNSYHCYDKYVIREEKKLMLLNRQLKQHKIKFDRYLVKYNVTAASLLEIKKRYSKLGNDDFTCPMYYMICKLDECSAFLTLIRAKKVELKKDLRVLKILCGELRYRNFLKISSKTIIQQPLK